MNISSWLSDYRFRAYIEAGRGGRDDWPWWILGGVLAAVWFLISQVIALGAAMLYLMFVKNLDVIGMADGDPVELMAALTGDPVAYLFFLLGFALLLLGLWFIQRLIHDRPFKKLMTAAARFRWKRMVFAALVYGVILGGLSYIGILMSPDDYEFSFDPSRFWVFLPLTLLFIPIQAASEEVLLRGYLSQLIGRFINVPLVVILLTSAVFALLHISNPEVAAIGPIMLGTYFAMGLFFSLLVYVDGGLESAIGVHAINNVLLATLFGYQDAALAVPTVWTSLTEIDANVLGLVIVAVPTLVILLATRGKFQKDLPEAGAF